MILFSLLGPRVLIKKTNKLEFQNFKVNKLVFLISLMQHTHTLVFISDISPLEEFMLTPGREGEICNLSDH